MTAVSHEPPGRVLEGIRGTLAQGEEQMHTNDSRYIADVAGANLGHLIEDENKQLLGLLKEPRDGDLAPVGPKKVSS